MYSLTAGMMKKTEIIMLQKKKMPELQNVLAEESRALYGTLSRRQKKRYNKMYQKELSKKQWTSNIIKETGISVDIKQKKKIY